MQKQLIKIFSPLKELKGYEKRNFWVLTLVYALVLFTYPMIRSVTDATILESLGIKSWNMANFYSILTLFCVINIFNWFQKRLGQKKIFLLITGFSLLIFSSLSFGLPKLSKLQVYSLFVWKEVYIVLLVHICLGLFNSHFKEEFAKSFFGPFGALTSLGSIGGGLITSHFTNDFGVKGLMYISCAVLVMILITKYFFRENLIELQEEKKKTPLKELNGIWSYVFLILLLVGLTQFLIYIINLNFNASVKDMFSSVKETTAYFGTIYTWINVAALLIQFFITPFALKNFSLKNNHRAIVGIYLLVFLPIIAFAGGTLSVLSLVFISSKSIDYSFFGTIKEMLYYPLKVSQKYAAKYIVDMFGYRFSKAVVALFFAYFFDEKLAKILFLVFTVFWLISVFRIFTINERLYVTRTQ